MIKVHVNDILGGSSSAQGPLLGDGGLSVFGDVVGFVDHKLWFVVNSSALVQYIVFGKVV